MSVSLLHVLLIAACLTAVVAVNETTGNAAKSNARDEPRRISQAAGEPVSLHCGDERANRRGSRIRNVMWLYKRCGTDTACDDPSLPDEWVVLPCSRKVGCKPTLDLGRPNADSNGVYRCSSRKRSPRILITYIVEIYDSNPRLDMRPDGNNEPDFPVEPPTAPVPVVKQAGFLLEMHCKAPGQRKQHGVFWHHKQCSSYHLMSPCDKFATETDLMGWSLVTLDGREWTGPTLTLEHPREDDSGLYRCSIKRPGSSIVVTYELLVVEKANSSVEFIDDAPYNVTVFWGQSAAFQCRVRSKLRPTIKWFREKYSDERIDAKPVVTFNNVSYEQLESTQLSFPNHMYLSKLVLPSVRSSDTGVYVCIDLHNLGAVRREAYLTVMPKYFQSNASDTDSDGPSHHWLFLLPVGFALLPTSVYLCCRWRRKNGAPCADGARQDGANNGPPKSRPVTDGRAIVRLLPTT